jgi:hypothetical protein
MAQTNRLLHLFRRVINKTKDIFVIANEVYNESAGANKVMLVEPVVIKPVSAIDALPLGSYVKVTGTTYTLDLINKAHNPATEYNIGDLVTNGGFVYSAQERNIKGTFDASKWRLEAIKSIGPIAITAGSVVCVGPFHNTVSVAGFLVDDDSVFKAQSR